MEEQAVSMVETIIQNATSVLTGELALASKITTFLTTDPLMAFILGCAVVGIVFGVVYRAIRSISLG